MYTDAVFQQEIDCFEWLGFKCLNKLKLKEIFGYEIDARYKR